VKSATLPTPSHDGGEPIRLYTPEETSTYLGLSPRTLRNKAGRREIHFTRPAGSRLIRFSAADIEANARMGAFHP
jgi:excisionase family DNA binding protein